MVRKSGTDRGTSAFHLAKTSGLSRTPTQSESDACALILLLVTFSADLSEVPKILVESGSVEPLPANPTPPPPARPPCPSPGTCSRNKAKGSTPPPQMVS